MNLTYKGIEHIKKYEKYFKAIACDVTIYEKLAPDEEEFIINVGEDIKEGKLILKINYDKLEGLYNKYIRGEEQTDITCNWQKIDCKDYQAERYRGTYKEIQIEVFRIKGLDGYSFRCDNVGFLAEDLKNTEIEEAKKEAVQMVVERIKELNKIIEGK